MQKWVRASEANKLLGLCEVGVNSKYNQAVKRGDKIEWAKKVERSLLVDIEHLSDRKRVNDCTLSEYDNLLEDIYTLEESMGKSKIAEWLGLSTQSYFQMFSFKSTRTEKYQKFRVIVDKLLKKVKEQK